MTQSESIALRVRELRELRGITQRVLGASIGSFQGTIQRIEKPGGANVTVETLEKLAVALGCSLTITLTPLEIVASATESTAGGAL